MNTIRPEIKNEIYLSFAKTVASTFIGPFLTETLFDLRGKLKQKRINDFVERLAAHFGMDNHLNIDQRLLTTEAFSDILENALVKVSRTRAESKIILFKQVLIDHIVSGTPPEATEMYLEIVDKLTEKQLLILKNLNETPTDRFASLHEKIYLLQTEMNTMEAELKREIEYIKDDSQEVGTRKIINEKEAQIGRLKVQTWEYKAFDPATYGCQAPEFKYLIQDLFNNGLIRDNGGRYGAEPFIVVEISEMGMAMLDFLAREGHDVTANA